MFLFSADDYGYSKTGSKKIIECYNETHIIKNTSILSNFVTTDAINDLKMTQMSIGIHLNILEGNSFGNHNTLTNESNLFYTKSQLVKRIIRGQIDFDEIYKEAVLQIENLLDYGLNISYADSHQNIHFIPQVMNKYEKALIKYKIKKLRGQKPNYTLFSNTQNSKVFIHFILSSIWHLIYDNRFITSKEIILKAPGLGLVVCNLNEALYLWNIAIKQHNNNLICEVPCHLDFSELEFDLYSSSEFLNLLNKHKIKTCSYGEL